MSPEEQGAARVALWLRTEGWQVYAEVEQPGGGPRADIVAVRDSGLIRRVHVVECKLRLGWDVLAQARAWTGWADHVSVATSLGPTGRRRAAALDAVSGMGLGWLEVWDGEMHVRVDAPAHPAPPRASLLLSVLRPEHALSRPGNADGDYWTAHDEHAAHLRRIVREDPDCELWAALCVVLGRRPTRVERLAWERQIRMGVVNGIALRRDGRRVRLAPAEECF